MKRHPLSEVWGDMPPDQFQELVEDVQKHGVREPIVCHDELILDGWHRVRAAAKAEKTCKFIPLPEGEDPASFVIRRNAHRRHLTASQRASAVIACHKWMQRGGDRRSDDFQRAPVPFENGDRSQDGERATTAEMAKEAGVSERTIKDTKVAERAGLRDKVRSGELSAKAAARKARGEDSEPKPSKPTPASAAKLRKENELLEAELTEAKLELNELRRKNDELEERIAFVQGESKPVAAVREEKFNNYRAHIQTLKHSVYRWQTQFQESNAENKALRRRLRALGENIRP